MKNKLFISLFFLLFASALYAQKDSTVFYLNSKGLTLDSAKRVVADKKISFEKKFEMIKSFETTPNDGSVLHDIYLKLIPEAKKQDDATALVYLYSHSSSEYQNNFDSNSNFDLAKLYLDSATLYVQKVKDERTLGGYYYYSGGYYQFNPQANFAESQYYYYKALPYFKGNIFVSILEYLSIESIEMNDIEGLRTIMDNLEQFIHKKQSDRAIILLNSCKYHYYHMLYEDSGNKIYLDSVIEFSKQQISFLNTQRNALRKDDYDIIISTAYYSLIEAEINKSETVNSIDYKNLYNTILEWELIAPIQYKKIWSEIQYIKAHFFYKSKQNDKAEKEALKGLDYVAEIEGKTDIKNIKIMLYDILSKTYESKHDYKQALKYEKLSNQLYTELNQTKQFQITKNYEKKYELDKKEQAIQELNNKYLAQKKIEWLFLIIIILVFAAMVFFVRWMRSRRKVLTDQLEINRLKSEEAERKVDQLKFRVVHSKFIPHFTGNVLNSINYLISKNPDSARKYISRFSDFSNSTLLNSDKLQQTIQEELDYSQLYLELEKLRFEERLEYSISVAPEVDTQKMIPTMILQTFCENAVKHGLRPKPEGGKIIIRVYRDTDNIVLAVEDTGIGREKAQRINTAGTREGLNIVQQQLDIFNSNQTKKAYLQIVDLHDEAGQPSGTRFELYVPEELIDLHVPTNRLLFQ